MRNIKDDASGFHDNRGVPLPEGSSLAFDPHAGG